MMYKFSESPNSREVQETAVLYPEGSGYFLFIFFLLLLLLDPSSFHLPVFLFYPTVHRHCRCSYTAGIRLPASPKKKDVGVQIWTNVQIIRPAAQKGAGGQGRSRIAIEIASPIGLPPPLARPKDASPKHHIFKKRREKFVSISLCSHQQNIVFLSIFILRIDSKY